MKSSISRRNAWLFTTKKRTPTRSSAALDDKTETVTNAGVQPVGSLLLWSLYV